MKFYSIAVEEVVKPKPAVREIQPDGSETKRTRSGRRSKKPASFQEKIEFSSGSDTERGNSRRRKRRRQDGPRPDTSGGVYTIFQKVKFTVASTRYQEGLPLLFEWDKDRRVTVARFLISQAIKRLSPFAKIDTGDELVSLNGKSVQSLGAKSSGDVNADVYSLYQRRKKAEFQFYAKKEISVRRLVTLKNDPILPDRLYEAVEELGGTSTRVVLLS